MSEELSPREGEAKTILLNPLCLVLSALGVLGALASLSVLPPSLARIPGVLLFFFVGALPLVLRVSPPAPSLFKVLTVSALLSPVFATSIYLALHLMLPADQSVAGCFFILGILQPFGMGRALKHQRLGRTAWFALGLGLLAGAAVWLLLFRGSAPRASYHGLLHSGLVLAVDRAVPPGHPWMAGEELGYYWFWHAIGALFSRALSIAPTLALSLTNLWAVMVLPVVFFFTAAPCFGSGKRERLGVVLALLGLNAMGGLVWLFHSRSWTAPTTSLEVLDSLRLTVGAWDPRLAFGFSKFGNLSSYPTALALFAGGLMCAVHAIRGAAKPWVGAAAALNGAAFAVNPIVGAVGIGSTLTSALLISKGARMRFLVAFVLWALPGAWLVLRAGEHYAGESIEFAWRDGVLWGTVAPILLLAVPALVLLVRKSSAANIEEDARRRALGLLALASALPLVLHLVVVLPYDNQYKLIRLAAIPLALLAAGGLVELFAHGKWARFAGRVLLALLLVGGGVGNGLGFASYYALSNQDLPLAEEPLAIYPQASPSQSGEPFELESLYRWLSELRLSGRNDAVLIVNCLRDTAPVYGPGAHAFTNPTLNLQGHEAAPFTGMSLFVDRPSQVLAQATPGWEARMRVLWLLYLGGGELSPAKVELLHGTGPGLLLITSSDRNAHPRIDSIVEAAGYEEVKRVGASSVFAWPRSLAAELKGEKR